MPASVELADLEDVAVLWPATGRPSRSGEARVGPPIEVACRWRRMRREVTDAQGNTVVIEASVMLDRPAPVGSQMWRGTLDEWEGVRADRGRAEVMRVATANETDDVKGRDTAYRVGLQKFRGDASAVDGGV